MFFPFWYKKNRKKKGVGNVVAALRHNFSVTFFPLWLSPFFLLLEKKHEYMDTEKNRKAARSWKRPGIRGHVLDEWQRHSFS